jgi:hypothetical protein
VIESAPAFICSRSLNQSGNLSDRAAAVNYPFGVTGRVAEAKNPRCAQCIFSGRYNKAAALDDAVVTQR